ncbi:MAG: hypothetical protein H0W58_08985 [Acidobacteria bacterium]|jgi:hypothetical protein|nr:hypothetical protein [Acidobacteriota bacterium]
MAKHEKTFVDYDKPYETNLIGFRGVIYFGVGLFLLIVVTFGLMWFLQNIMEEQAIEAKDQKNPMAMNEQERLPPEPRLQAAPGFGVDSVPGRVNLELNAPQSEYRELHQQWEKIWKDGQTDPQTGTVISLPIEQAKENFLQENVKSDSSEKEQKMLKDSRSMFSSSSAGRVASDVRR